MCAQARKVGLLFTSPEALAVLALHHYNVSVHWLCKLGITDKVLVPLLPVCCDNSLVSSVTGSPVLLTIFQRVCVMSCDCHVTLVVCVCVCGEGEVASF